MKGAASPKVPISAGRQCRRSFGNGSGASREEAPEESVFLKRDAVPGLPDLLRKAWKFGERSGTQEGPTQEGPRNIGWLWLCQAPVVERQANPRVAQSGKRSVSSSEGVVRWKATPELVSLDFWEEFFGTRTAKTGRSFARRSGGWQQCRPPFLFGPGYRPKQRNLRNA